MSAWADVGLVLSLGFTVATQSLGSGCSGIHHSLSAVLHLFIIINSLFVVDLILRRVETTTPADTGERGWFRHVKVVVTVT